MNDSVSFSPAERQKKFRKKARAEFGVRVVTYLLRPCEDRFLRGAFLARYGHEMSATARREFAASKASAVANDAGEQLELIPGN